ncbi:MAG TPA: lysoplasmalogenase, partial [Ferruginibacter sp.]|nr:lysoplasmalogenase [Ferruginibacter sp.]
SLLKTQPWWPVLAIMYGGGLLYFLFPSLGKMELPVTVYAVVITTMLICSIHAFRKTNSAAGSFFILGALFFVLSDSLLAINKFYQPFSFAQVLIMLTYCAAQFFIVMGYAKTGR